MPVSSDAFAMLGISLVLCAGLLAVLTVWCVAGAQVMWMKLLTVFGFVLLWMPLGDAQIPAVAYVRGITGDLSITLIALAVWRIGQCAFGWRASSKQEQEQEQEKEQEQEQEQVTVMAAVAVAALFLYPLALGWGDWDAYRPGWGSWGMLLALLTLCTVCWAKGLWVLPALVALALLAWTLGLMESGNLWDYLLDPWLSVFALCFMFIKYMKMFFRRWH